jgi:hypothetical protein
MLEALLDKPEIASCSSKVKSRESAKVEQEIKRLGKGSVRLCGG